MQGLRVSDDRRHLLRADGSAFFYLGDTAWELFHRLGREDADHYLRDRASKGFTVIQAVALAEHEFETPNPYGALPLEDSDPARPSAAYFEHVDWIVRRANDLGLYVGMLPTWGDKWNRKWGVGPELFTPDSARAYGTWMGARYRDAGVLWILGGDRPVETDMHRATIRAMAAGLKKGDGGTHLMTFHPPGPHTSSEYWPDEPWLDFHMWQSGHSRNTANYEGIARDYALTPVKPCLDSEPAYEDHPESFSPENGYLNDYDVRKNAYWALFAGACGHTYGCHDIWQFLDPARFTPVTAPHTLWREALHLPGAGQMRHLRALIESRPPFSLVPDQRLIAGDTGAGGEHVQAARAADGGYAFVYQPVGREVTVRTSLLAGDALDARWYDPRTGGWTEIGRFPRSDTRAFTPPTPGVWTDWVLVLDRA